MQSCNSELTKKTSVFKVTGQYHNSKLDNTANTRIHTLPHANVASCLAEMFLLSAKKHTGLSEQAGNKLGAPGVFRNT